MKIKLIDYEKCRNNNYDDIITTYQKQISKDFKVSATKDTLSGMPTCHSLDKRFEKNVYHRFLTTSSGSSSSSSGKNLNDNIRNKRRSSSSINNNDKMVEEGNNEEKEEDRIDFLFKISKNTTRRHRRRYSYILGLPPVNELIAKPTIVIRKKSKSMDFVLSTTRCYRSSVKNNENNKNTSVIKQMLGKRREKRHGCYLSSQDDDGCCHKKSYLFYDPSITERGATRKILKLDSLCFNRRKSIMF